MTISDIPIFYEAIAASLAAQASVRSLRPAGDDTEAVLRAIDPDAVIVDSSRDASEARQTALDFGIRLIHVPADESMLRVLSADGWSEHPLSQLSTEAFQNLILASALGAG